MSEKWLSCTVEEGMFSDESVVVFSTIDGQQVSFFVPRSAVKRGQLKVKAFQQSGQWWAVLPNEEQSVVPIKKEMLAVA